MVLKKFNNPEYYFHVTQNPFWGKEIILKPKPDGGNRSSGEPKLPRICASPTIEQCLVALGECLRCNASIYIYRTKNKIKTMNPRGIVDSKLTGEVWIINKTKFIKIGHLVPSNLPEELFWMNTGTKFDIKTQKKMLLKLKKHNVKKLIVTK